MSVRNTTSLVVAISALWFGTGCTAEAYCFSGCDDDLKASVSGGAGGDSSSSGGTVSFRRQERRRRLGQRGRERRLGELRARRDLRRARQRLRRSDRRGLRFHSAGDVRQLLEQLPRHPRPRNRTASPARRPTRRISARRPGPAASPSARRSSGTPTATRGTGVSSTASGTRTGKTPPIPAAQRGAEKTTTATDKSTKTSILATKKIAVAAATNVLCRTPPRSARRRETVTSATRTTRSAR